MPNDIELIKGVFSRILTTHDEHEALQRLLSNYHQAYKLGFEHAKDTANNQIERDNNLLKMAEAYQTGCPLDRYLAELRSIDKNTSLKYTYENIAARLLRLGVTAENMDRIREAYDEETRKQSSTSSE